MANDPFDPLAGFEESSAPKAARKGATRHGYQNPLGDVSQSDVRKAVKSSKAAGRFLRVTLLLLPELEEAIETVAQENGIGKNEAARWLLSLGLRDYFINGARPQIERVTASKVTLPKWRGGR